MELRGSCIITTPNQELHRAKTLQEHISCKIKGKSLEQTSSHIKHVNTAERKQRFYRLGFNSRISRAGAKYYDLVESRLLTASGSNKWSRNKFI